MGHRGFCVKTVLPSGNTAVYDVSERFVRRARPDFVTTDCERSRQDVLMYGEHLATLLPHDGGHKWFRPRTQHSYDRSYYDSIPELSDLCYALGMEAGLFA